MNVTKEFRNNLLKRKEMVLELEDSSNPGMKKVSSEVAKKLGVSEDCIVVKKLNSGFGSKKFLAEVFVYDSADEKVKIEPKIKVKKEGGK